MTKKGKRRWMVFLIIILILAFAAYNYEWFATKLYGIKDVSSYTMNDVEEIDNEVAIKELFPNAVHGYMDPSFYTYLKQLGNKDAIHDLKQPAQAIYFDSNGSMISFHINCYAGSGFPNLNWNEEKQFDQFPPKTSAPIYPIISEKSLEPFFKNWNNKSINIHADGKYHLYLIWSNVIYRQNKNLWKTVTQNISQFNKTDSITIILLNIDTLYKKYESQFQ